MIALATHILLLAAFCGLIVWAAVRDLRHFIIPNWICAAIAGLYPFFVLTSPAAVDWLGALLVCAVTAIVMVTMFILRMIGGGDVKMLVAMSLWAGPALFVELFVVSALAGGVMAVLYGWVLRKDVPALAGGGALDEESGTEIRETVLPYGVALATGGLFIAGQLLLR